MGGSVEVGRIRLKNPTSRPDYCDINRSPFQIGNDFLEYFQEPGGRVRHWRLHESDHRILAVPLAVMVDTPIVVYLRRRLGRGGQNQWKLHIFSLFTTDNAADQY